LQGNKKRYLRNKFRRPTSTNVPEKRPSSTKTTRWWSRRRRIHDV